MYFRWRRSASGDFHRRPRRTPTPRHRKIVGQRSGADSRAAPAGRPRSKTNSGRYPRRDAGGVGCRGRRGRGRRWPRDAGPAGDAPSPCSSTNFVVADVGIEHLQSEGLASRVVPSSRRGSRAGRYRRSRRGAERRRWSRFPTSGAVREDAPAGGPGPGRAAPRGATGGPRPVDELTNAAGRRGAGLQRRRGSGLSPPTPV